MKKLYVPKPNSNIAEQKNQQDKAESNYIFTSTPPTATIVSMVRTFSPWKCDTDTPSNYEKHNTVDTDLCPIYSQYCLNSQTPDTPDSLHVTTADIEGMQIDRTSIDIPPVHPVTTVYIAELKRSLAEKDLVNAALKRKLNTAKIHWKEAIDGWNTALDMLSDREMVVSCSQIDNQKEEADNNAGILSGVHAEDSEYDVYYKSVKGENK